MMPKLAKALGALAVSKLTAPGLHPVGTVPGLALNVAATGARSWILRTVVAGRRREMGLGGYPAVTLADAHRKAREAREAIEAGIDPLAQKRAARSALRAAEVAALTFEQCAGKFIAAKSPEWKNAKHAQQWQNTLEQHAYPTIGAMLVRDIELPQVTAVLEPIWKTKTETASRLRGRIEAVLDWATVNEYRTGLNPARWRGHLDKVLSAPAKVAKVKHRPALAPSQVGEFMAALRGAEGTGARALEFAILCASRSGEVRLMTHAEVDHDAKVWTIPAARMKAKREHRVPLSDAALAVLKAVPPVKGSDYVFAAQRGGALSDMTLTAVIRRMNEGQDPAPWLDPKTGAEVVPHGFRSTFRDWASEQTDYPRDVAEMALAHTIGDKVEAAYRRGDLFDKRRSMMDAWATFARGR